MDKKKIGAGFAGALQKAADATKAAKLAVQDMAADAKQSREKKKADAQIGKGHCARGEEHCYSKRTSDHLLSDGSGRNGLP